MAGRVRSIFFGQGEWPVDMLIGLDQIQKVEVFFEQGGRFSDKLDSR